MGRKSKWETHVLPRLEAIKEMCQTMTEEQICEALDVGTTAFTEYKKAHPELVEALKKGRGDLVKRLKGNLIKRADGYDYEEKKTIEEFIAIPKEVREMLLDAGIDPELVFNTQVTTVRVETSLKHERPDVAANNALLRVYDDEWHESTADDRRRKDEELNIKKQRAEAESW